MADEFPEVVTQIEAWVDDEGGVLFPLVPQPLNDDRAEKWLLAGCPQEQYSNDEEDSKKEEW